MIVCFVGSTGLESGSLSEYRLSASHYEIDEIFFFLVRALKEQSNYRFSDSQNDTKIIEEGHQK